LESVDQYDGSDHSSTTDAAFAALLRQKPFRGLEKIAAWNDGLGNETARAVAEAKLTALRHLDLGMNFITSAGAEAIAASKYLAALRHLDLSSNDIHNDRGAGGLIASPNLANLTVLKLSRNQFSGLGPKALPPNPRGPTLRALDLDTCNLWPSGAKRLFKCPAVRGLWRLDLGYSDIDDSSVVALAASGMDRLAALSLRGNEITARGLKALVGSALAARLQWLSLAGVNLTAPDVPALTDGTKLTNLKCLMAGGRGLARLRKHFGNKVVVSA
jgi:Leucine-rich repeat (LRR) protein